jgi:hypothetical protein
VEVSYIKYVYTIKNIFPPCLSIFLHLLILSFRHLRVQFFEKCVIFWFGKEISDSLLDCDDL